MPPLQLRAATMVRHQDLWCGIAIILICVASAFAQSSISFSVKVGATNKPVLGYLRLIRGAGCSDFFGATLDPLAQTYAAGRTLGCDYSAVYVHGPKFDYISSFAEFGLVSAYGIAVDPSGNTYLTGTNQDCCSVPAINVIQGCQVNFPGSTNPTLADPVFLMKLNPNGTVVYSTCIPKALGAGRGVAVDKSGAAYVIGDGGFVAKINSTPAVVYSTVLASPTGITIGNGIAVDTVGDAYLTGTTGPGFTLVNPINSAGPGAFLAKLNPSGNALIYSTYLAGGTSGNGVAVDAIGNAYVTTDAGATKVNPTGSAVVYSTTKGAGLGIALDAHGGAYVTGKNIVTQLSQNGAWMYSMNINDSGWNQGTAIAVDKLGTVYPVGITSAMDFPSTDSSRCATNDGFTCVGNTGFIGQIGPFSTASVSPASLTFGTQLVSTKSVAKKISLFNTGTAQMTVSSLQVSGDYLVQTNYCGSGVRPSTHCDIYLTFSPKKGGARTGTLAFYDNAASSPQKVILTGVGTTVLVSPTSLSYGTQRVGTTSLTKAITITNRGSAVLTISSITKSGDFIIPSKTCGATLAGGASCKLNVAFRPTLKGIRTGSVAISHSGGASPAKVSLTGTGV